MFWNDRNKWILAFLTQEGIPFSKAEGFWNVLLWVESTVHAVNSNESRILGKIRLDYFVISLNLEIGFLRVKSMFLKGQVSPSLYKDGIVFLLRERKSKNYQERSSSNSGPWYWAQPPPACPISSVRSSVHLSLAIPPIHLVLHGSWSGTWHKLHSSLDLLILFSSKWWIILVPGIRHQLLQSFHFLYLRYLQ